MTPFSIAQRSSADTAEPRMSTDQTGLEKAASRTPAIITTPDEYRGALLRWQEQHYNVLSPFTNLSGLAAQHGLITSLVQISVDKADEEVYDNSGGLPWLKDGEVAFAKRGLRKIAECAGISTSTRRTDPYTIAFYWELKAIGTYRDVTGAIVTREASMEWDLRDGSDRLKGFKPNQITEARKNGLRNCETRAINALIRECGCGLKQKYTKAELAKPFVVVRVMFMPDLSDPETRRLVTERALAGTNALYPARAIAGEVIDVAGEPTSVGRGATSPTSSQPTSTSNPDPNQPPSPNAVRVEKVESKSGEKNGRKWTCWTVIDSNGVEYSTFSKTIAEAAEKHKADRRWVDIVDEQNGEYRNIVELGPAQPSLLPDPSQL
jgi:hypothetical protein